MAHVKRNQEDIKNSIAVYGDITRALCVEIDKISNEAMKKLINVLENPSLKDYHDMEHCASQHIVYGGYYRLIPINRERLRNDHKYPIDLDIYDQLHCTIIDMMVDVHKRFEKVLNESSIEEVFPYHDKDTIVKDLASRLSVVVNSLVFGADSIYYNIALTATNPNWKKETMIDRFRTTIRDGRRPYIAHAHHIISTMVKDYINDKNASVLDTLFAYRAKWELYGNDDLERRLSEFISDIITRYTEGKSIYQFQKQFIRKMMASSLYDDKFEEYIHSDEFNIDSVIEYLNHNDSKSMVHQYLIDRGIIDDDNPKSEDDSNKSDDNDEPKENLNQHVYSPITRQITPSEILSSNASHPVNSKYENDIEIDWNYVRENLIIATKQLEDIDFNDLESIQSSALYNYIKTSEDADPIDVLENSYKAYFSDLFGDVRDYTIYGSNFKISVDQTITNVFRDIKNQYAIENIVKYLIESINDYIGLLQNPVSIK